MNTGKLYSTCVFISLLVSALTTLLVHYLCLWLYGVAVLNTAGLLALLIVCTLLTLLVIGSLVSIAEFQIKTYPFYKVLVLCVIVGFLMTAIVGSFAVLSAGTAPPNSATVSCVSYSTQYNVIVYQTTTLANISTVLTTTYGGSWWLGQPQCNQW